MHSFGVAGCGEKHAVHAEGQGADTHTPEEQGGRDRAQLRLPPQNTLAAAGGGGAQLCLLRNFNCGQLRESCQRHSAL